MTTHPALVVGKAVFYTAHVNYAASQNVLTGIEILYKDLLL